MSGMRMGMILILVILWAAGGAGWGQEHGATQVRLARHLIDMADLSHGICTVLGPADPGLSLEMTAASRFFVHVLGPDQPGVLAVQTAAEKRGLPIQRLLAECMPLDRLPYADSLVDLVLVPNGGKDALGPLPRAEILRILRPRGKLILNAAGASPAALEQWCRDAGLQDPSARAGSLGTWVMASKPALEGAADWRHWEHEPDNNAVSTDAVIKAPYRTQWLGEPYYIAMPAITLAAGGRTFLAMGHIAHHEREEPWLNTVLARNGYNGAALWRRRLPDGYFVHRSAFIATADTFYMIQEDGRGCLLLDPETGSEQGRIRLGEDHWKWIALMDGVLYVLMDNEPDPKETTVIRSLYPAWSWGELSSGYYTERVPWGFGRTLMAYDLAKKKVLWSHEEDERIDSRALAMGEGKLYFYGPDSRLGCLDAQSGEVLWVNAEAPLRGLIEEPGRGLSSTPGFRSTCFCIYTPAGLFFEGQTRQNIVAVSKDDGSLLWHRSKTTSNPNVIYLDGQILVGIGEEGNTLVLDPKTGETREDLGFRKRSCVRLTATSDSLFCRGYPEGVTRYDRNTKVITFDGSMRPACNDGVIGANGLLYQGPWLCDCNLSIMGAVAQCSAGSFQPEALSGERLEYHADALSPPGLFGIGGQDWYAYRSNNEHNATSKTQVSSALLPLWTSAVARAFAPTAPIAAGGAIFLAGNDGKIRALDAQTGVPRWSFQTAGPILQSPTAWKGQVFAGSGDGCVYALDAATGRLIWRFRAAPVERRTMIYGSLCSTWPVNSGVVVHNGVAYAAAGIIDYDGTYVYALDAETGALQWVNNSSGHLDKTLRKGVSAQGNLTIMNNAVWLAAGNIMPPAPYDLDTGQYLDTTGPGDGSPRTNRGEEIGVFRGRHIVTGGRLRYSVTDNIVNPGRFTLSREGAEPMPFAAGRVAPAWDETRMVSLPGREAVPSAFDGDALEERLNRNAKTPPRSVWSAKALEGSKTLALAMAENGVVAVCETPRFRSLQKRYRVCLLDRADGSLQWEYDLPGVPRLNGAAIDRDGRILVTLADGRLLAFGTYEALQATLAGLASLAQGGGVDKAVVVHRLQDALDRVHHSEGRAVLIASLKRLGVDVLRPLREAGYVCSWHLCGPVPWDDNGNPVDRVFVGEPAVQIAQTVQVSGETLGWREYLATAPGGMVDLAAVFGSLAAKAAYAYAQVELSEAQDLLLKIGSNDGFKCWFNGEEVGRFEGGRSYRPDQDSIEVHGKRGANTILLKVTQMGGAWACGARLTAPDGTPIVLPPVTP